MNSSSNAQYAKQVMLGEVERKCRQIPHATIGAENIVERMQVKYFVKLGLEMWGYACLPRQGR